MPIRSPSQRFVSRGEVSTGSGSDRVSIKAMVEIAARSLPLPVLTRSMSSMSRAGPPRMILRNFVGNRVHPPGDRS